MKKHLVELACTVDVVPGEKLTLPAALVDGLSAGRWIVTVRPWNGPAEFPAARRHDAFLNGYAPEDDGLYDDLAG